MEKIMLLIILLIAISVAAHASPLSMDYSVELGWVPGAAFGGYEQMTEWFYKDGFYYHPDMVKGYDFWNSFYTELKTKVWLWNTLYIGGGVTVQIHAVLESISFDPDFTNYNFVAGIKLGMVDLFYSHDCTHPQMTYNEFYRVTSLWGEGAINRAGIRISNK